MTLALFVAAISVTVTAEPAQRSGFAMWAEEAGGRIVIFGGLDNASEKLDDSWAWSGEAWKRLETKGRGHVQDSMFCYDSSRGRCISFGGITREEETGSRETRELIGDRWEVKSARGPVARSRGAMAFDEARKVCVLYGGVDNARNRLSDTWTWDGSSWSKAADGPTAMSSHALVYFPPEKAVYLLGYDYGSGKKAFWKWDGKAWSMLDSKGAPMVVHAAVAYDSDRRRVVVHGGFDDEGRSDATWEWDGKSWNKSAPAGGPGHRAEHEGVFLSGRGFYVFGGVSGKDTLAEPRIRTNDLWLLAKGRWTRQYPAGNTR